VRKRKGWRFLKKDRRSRFS